MKLLCALCVLCGLALPAKALNREAFTFTKYDLNVRIEPDQQRMGVRGTITLRNDSHVPQKNLSLQISSGLAWRSIQLAGEPLQFVSQPYSSDIDHTGELSEAIVALPQAIPPGGTVVLAIGYEGVVALDTTRLQLIGVPKEQAQHTDWDQIGGAFTAVRGVGYVAWYPVAIEAATLADGNSVFEALGRWKAREAQSVMRINLDYTGQISGLPLYIFCNSALETYGNENLGLAEHDTAGCPFSSLGQTVPLFAMGRYLRLEQPVVKIFYRTEKNAAEDYARAVQKVSPLITDWFGAPREKPEVIELSDPAAAPYESGSTLLTPLNQVDAKAAEIAAAHQFTHAAFYSPRPWIYEGAAHFAQALYREQQNGRQAALDFMNEHARPLADVEKTIAAQRASKSSTEQSLINTNVEELYRSKAMYVWWMLRDMVGEPALKKALAAYHADQDKDPAYLEHLIEAQTKTDLAWFFDDWVYHDRGLPGLRVDSVYPSQTANGNYLVTVTIGNDGGAGVEVPITIRARDGDTTKRLEVHGKAKNSVRMLISSFPLEVDVNDGSVPENDMTNNVFKVPPPAEPPSQP